MRVLSLGQEDPLGVGNGYPLHGPCLGDFLPRGACGAAVHAAAQKELGTTECARVYFSRSLRSPFSGQIHLSPALRLLGAGLEDFCRHLEVCEREVPAPWGRRG